MKTLIAIALATTFASSAFAQDATPNPIKSNNRFTECVQKWRDYKASPEFVKIKFAYREHMSKCLRKDQTAQAPLSR